MIAKELFCWALSSESLVCCIRAGSPLTYSQHIEERFVSALLILHSFVCTVSDCMCVCACVASGTSAAIFKQQVYRTVAGFVANVTVKQTKLQHRNKIHKVTFVLYTKYIFKSNLYICFNFLFQF